MNKSTQQVERKQDVSNYIDGFVFPIPRKHLDAYKQVAEQVANIWKEYGALEYQEYVGEDLHLEGTRSFANVADAQADEVVVFGWVAFPSKAVRMQANKQVPNDPRIHALVSPLVDPSKLIFDASRMIYGGFQALVKSGKP